MEIERNAKKVVVLRKRLGEIKADETRRLLKGMFKGQEYLSMPDFQRGLEDHFDNLSRNAERTLHDEGLIGYELTINGNLYPQAAARGWVRNFMRDGFMQQAHYLADALVYAEPSDENKGVYQEVMLKLQGNKKAARSATAFKAGMTIYNHGAGAEAAIPHLEDAFRFDKKNDAIPYALAGMLFHESETACESPTDLSKARKMAERAVKLNPDNSEYRELKRMIEMDQRRSRV